MWFKRIFVPDCELKSEKIEVVKVRNIGELVERVK
jgi:hypothetical protein